MPAKPNEPGARSFQSGVRSYNWAKLVPNPNFKRAAAPEAPAAAPATPAPAPYTPTPLVAEPNNQSSLMIGKAPEPPAPPPPPQFSPGGVGATLDGNASGFRRKKSSARMSGLTTKGTGRFKISGAGQSSSSSGLNIGV